MTNTTIYLAKITKTKDYDRDILVECEAFTSLEKAKAFMVENNMIEMSYGWEKPNDYDYLGEIISLKLK